MYRTLLLAWKNKPLTVILSGAILVRLIAVVFSRGYGMLDDHFLVIEPAQAWADGINYRGWLPWGREGVQPDGHSLLYSGFHYLLFLFFNGAGLHDPQVKMLFIRLLHALFSLLTVWYGFKISKKIAGEKAAVLTALLLSFFWFFPFLGVRNLVEMVCIPFMMAGMWQIVSADDSPKPFLQYLLGGILLGIAFSIRFQTSVFIFGAGLALLLKNKWLPALSLTLGFLASVLPVQGLIDYFIWGRPFAEFHEYVNYNVGAAYDYIIGPWYNYMLLLAGILLIPVSIYLLIGFFRNWKKEILLFLPVFLFLLFHSIFPNKQERFIFPIIPLVIVLGVAGWYGWKNNPFIHGRFKGFHRGSWMFFWVINLLLLSVLSTTYSKKSLVESMYYLSRYPEIRLFAVEDTNRDDTRLMPQFYMNQWPKSLKITRQGIECFSPDLAVFSDSLRNAAFILFQGDENLESRVEAIRRQVPALAFEAEFKPGFVDYIMHRLNPVNKNEVVTIYRNTDVLPFQIP